MSTVRLGLLSLRSRRACRYSQITRIAVKHGNGPYLTGRRVADHRRHATLGLRLLFVVFRAQRGRPG